MTETPEPPHARPLARRLSVLDRYLTLSLVGVALRWRRRYFPHSEVTIEGVANCAVPAGISARE